MAAGQLLKPASWKQAFTPYTLTSGKQTAYGYGWAISKLQGSPMSGARGPADRHRRLLPQGKDIPPVANEAIAIRVSCLWMQLGIENRAAADLAAAAGLDVVMDRCIKVEHAKLRA